MKRQRVLIASGGTGGHIFPAQALISALPDSLDIRWVGRSNSMESAAAQAVGVPLWDVDVQGVRGKSKVSAAIAIFKFCFGVLQLVYRMIRWRPSVVVGFGGYVSAAAGFAAVVLRIPLVLHEQNAVAGSTNRLLAKFATAIAESFPGSFASATCTGNPVRQGFSPRYRDSLQGRALRILVVGGSQGAAVLNAALPKAIDGLSNVEIKHQCGRGHLQETQSQYAQSSQSSVDLFEFDPQLDSYYDWADVLIARAGASTVAELAASRLPAVLVPLPHAIDDHQRANARHVVAIGGAIMLEQGAELAQTLEQQLLALIESNDKIPQMSKSLDAFAMEGARTALAVLVMEKINDN